jgi:mycothiol synthase
MTNTGIPQLRMIISDISVWQLDWELPDGYELVVYSDGLEQHWVTIIGESFNKVRTVDDWRELILAKEGYRPDRVFFIREKSSGEMCATATAVRSGGPQHGYLHFVGVRPKWSGHKLGFFVSCLATESFKTDGCTDAMLNTDPPRIAALKTYLRIGYRPVPWHEAHVEIWKRILSQTGFEHLAVQVRLPSRLSG